MGKIVKFSSKSGGSSTAKADTRPIKTVKEQAVELWVINFFSVNPDALDVFRPYLEEFLENDSIPSVDVESISGLSEWMSWCNLEISPDNIARGALEAIVLEEFMQDVSHFQNILDKIGHM
jgi:hypothetical protein